MRLAVPSQLLGMPLKLKETNISAKHDHNKPKFWDSTGGKAVGYLQA